MAGSINASFSSVTSPATLSFAPLPGGTSVCRLASGRQRALKDATTGEWGDASQLLRRRRLRGHRPSATPSTSPRAVRSPSKVACAGAHGSRRTARSAPRSASSPTTCSSSARATSAASQAAARAALRSAHRQRCSAPAGRAVREKRDLAGDVGLRRRHTVLSSQDGALRRAPRGESATCRVPPPSRGAGDEERPRGSARTDVAPATSAMRRSKRSTSRTSRLCVASCPRRARSAPGTSPATCRRHQSQVAVAIKRAREMALLPYVNS